MTTKNWKIRDWVALAWSASLAVLALLAIYPGLGTAWCWARSNAGNISGWFQAIGSIAAIWVAFRVANLQFAVARARDDETERQRKRKKYMLLYDRFHSCTVLVQGIIEKSLLDQNDIEIARMAVKEMHSLIKEIAVEDIPDLEIFTHVSNFRIRLEVLGYSLIHCSKSVQSEQHPRNVKLALEAVTNAAHWGGNSRDICSLRLFALSLPHERAELIQHIKELKEAAAAAQEAQKA